MKFQANFHCLYIGIYVTVTEAAISIQAMSSEDSGKGLLLKADSIASKFCSEVKESLLVCSRPPKLVGILATSSAPSKFYADFTKKQCDELGIEFVLKRTGAADTGLSESEGVEEAIIEANEDDSIDGIMVRTPFFSW